MEYWSLFTIFFPSETSIREDQCHLFMNKKKKKFHLAFINLIFLINNSRRKRKTKPFLLLLQKKRKRDDQNEWQLHEDEYATQFFFSRLVTQPLIKSGQTEWSVFIVTIEHRINCSISIQNCWMQAVNKNYTFLLNLLMTSSMCVACLYRKYIDFWRDFEHSI